MNTAVLLHYESFVVDRSHLDLAKDQLPLYEGLERVDL